MELSNAVKGMANDDVVPVSDVVRGLVGILDELDALVDETPPVHVDQRFGNPAFKTWHGRLSDRAHELVARVCGLDLVLFAGKGSVHMRCASPTRCSSLIKLDNSGDVCCSSHVLHSSFLAATQSMHEAFARLSLCEC